MLFLFTPLHYSSTSPIAPSGGTLGLASRGVASPTVKQCVKFWKYLIWNLKVIPKRAIWFQGQSGNKATCRHGNSQLCKLLFVSWLSSVLVCSSDQRASVVVATSLVCFRYRGSNQIAAFAMSVFALYEQSHNKNSNFGGFYYLEWQHESPRSREKCLETATPM